MVMTQNVLEENNDDSTAQYSRRLKGKKISKLLRTVTNLYRYIKAFGEAIINLQEENLSSYQN